jgi:hypothetical protein
MTIINFVTPKVAAKSDLSFHKPAYEESLLNKSSCLAAALGVTKFVTITLMVLVTLCCAAQVRL